MTSPAGAVPGTDDLPEALAEIVEEFHALGLPDRLQMLLEFSRDLPALPERLAEHREAMEPVPECQSPIFLLVEIDTDGAGPVTRLFFDAPREAPTTRGFAGVLQAGLDGLAPQQIADLPDDVPFRLGLTEAVSPLRLRGMAGMLGRIKRQVREKA